jgi:hypothetical protein
MWTRNSNNKHDEKLDTVQETGSLRHKNEIVRENYVMTIFFLAVYCKGDRIKEGKEIGKYRMHASDDQFVQMSGRKDWKKDGTMARLDVNN